VRPEASLPRALLSRVRFSPACASLPRELLSRVRFSPACVSLPRALLTAAAASAESCVACPSDSYSVTGSANIDQCYCNPGYRQTLSHDACSQCDPGYYDKITNRYEFGGGWLNLPCLSYKFQFTSWISSSESRSSSPRIGRPSRSCVSATAARASRNSASFTSLRSTRPQSRTPPCAWR
jgi:hypothetical protein